MVLDSFKGTKVDDKYAKDIQNDKHLGCALRLIEQRDHEIDLANETAEVDYVDEGSAV